MLLEFLMEAFSFMVLLFKGIAKSVWLGKVAMMLVKCPECGHEMSNGAKSCPRCGWSNAPLQAKRKLTRWMAITIVLSVFGVFWAFSLDQGQLYNRAGAYDIVVNGIPLQIVLSIPPVAAILAGVFNAASSSAGVVAPYRRYYCCSFGDLGNLLAPFRNRNVYECEWGWGRNVPRMHFCFYFFDFRVACIKKTCLSGYLQRWRMARQYDFEPAKCSEHLAGFSK